MESPWLLKVPISYSSGVVCPNRNGPFMQLQDLPEGVQGAATPNALIPFDEAVAAYEKELIEWAWRAPTEIAHKRRDCRRLPSASLTTRSTHRPIDHTRFKVWPIAKDWNGRSHGVRPLCRVRNVGVLRTGIKEPLVRPGVRGIVCTRLGVWLHARCLAVRHC
jgi:hypothetical protein